MTKIASMPGHHHPSLVRHYVTEFGLAALTVSGTPPRIVVVSDPFKVADGACAFWTTSENADALLRAASQILAASPIVVSAPLIEDLIAVAARALSISLTPHSEMLPRVYRGLDKVEGQMRDMRDKGGLKHANRRWRENRLAGVAGPKTYSGFATVLLRSFISELARKVLETKAK
ncbi:MAG: hypothetical protein JWM36_3197 [Hyphomicrobiales bacterium]|nr:hypothetical protein [Hyphomicrobiales bacterium]